VQPAIIVRPAPITFPPPPTPPPAKSGDPADPLSPAAAHRFRQQLGLLRGDLDHRPAALSGHQAGFWHAGIAAKWFALEALAKERPEVATGWVVVDHDTNPFDTLRVPVRTPDGTLEATTYRAQPGDAALREGIPGRAQPPFSPTLPSHDLLSRAASPSVRAGLLAVHRALADAQPLATSAADQLAHAAAALLAADAPAPPLIPAAKIAATDLFRALVQRMASDPLSCARAYNAAALAARAPGIAPLAIAGDKVELPLWHVPQPSISGPRKRVYAHDLPTLDPSTLAPRALFLTLLLRLAACDLFIAGLGGSDESGYDRATQPWATAWLGHATRLAPVTVVSATVLADLADTPPVTREDTARAAWALHAARHNPTRLGADAFAAEHARLVSALNARPRLRTPQARAERRRLFLSLHALLETARQAPPAHAHLSAAQRRLADLHAAAARDRLAADRTWPFPFLPAASLAGLRRTVAAAVTGPQTR
jgi:hypothetical protein